MILQNVLNYFNESRYIQDTNRINKFVKIEFKAVRQGNAHCGAAMPFIDDDLLWCPDNDGRMIDYSACLDAVQTGNQINDGSGGMNMGGANANIIGANGVINHQSQQLNAIPSLPCDLNGIDPMCNDSDELLRQLADNTFELDFLTDFTNTVIKEENNNDVDQSSDLDSSMNASLNSYQNQIDNINLSLISLSNLLPNGTSCSTLSSSPSSTSSSSSSSSSTHSRILNRFTIASNPLLAEKLLTPNLTDMENLGLGSTRIGRPPDIKGKRFVL